jgi:hypothetical protein
MTFNPFVAGLSPVQGGIPLFIQFKLSHYLKRANAKECKSGHFSTPYYRMHIRPKRHSKQHELLLDLENLGNEVYYSAPAFHEPVELNDAYLKKQVKNMSLWVKPTDIGTITDYEEHYLVFQLPNTWFFCSKPKTIERDLSFLTFSENINNSLNQRQETALTKDSLRKLAMNLAKIGRKRTDIFLEEDVLTEEVLSNRHPIEMGSYYSSIYLDSQLIILQKASEI